MNSSDTVLSPDCRTEGHWCLLDTIAMAQNGLLLKLLKSPFKGKKSLSSIYGDFLPSDTNYGSSFRRKVSKKISSTQLAVTLHSSHQTMMKTTVVRVV